MGKAFDATGSYDVLLVRLAAATLGAGALMLAMPRYDARPRVRAATHQDRPAPVS